MHRSQVFAKDFHELERKQEKSTQEGELRVLEGETNAKRGTKRNFRNRRVSDVRSYGYTSIATLPWLPATPSGLQGWQHWQRVTWEVLESPQSSTVGLYVNVFILCSVVASSIVSVIETVPEWRTEYSSAWAGIECAFVIIFTIELVVRFIASSDKRHFLLNTANVVDLVVVLPWWTEQLVILFSSEEYPNISVLRMMRIARAIRMIKLGKSSKGFTMVSNAFLASVDALQLFMVILFISLIACASMTYFLERGEYDDLAELYYRAYDNGVQESGMPELLNQDCWEENQSNLTLRLQCERKPSPFQSVPHSMWFCLVTLMTVGYGDSVPITYTGQVIVGITVLIGIITLVLPLSIIQSSFMEKRRKTLREEHEMKCGAAVDANLGLIEEQKFNGKDGLSPLLCAALNKLKSTKENVPQCRKNAAECIELIKAIRMNALTLQPNEHTHLFTRQKHSKVAPLPELPGVPCECHATEHITRSTTTELKGPDYLVKTTDLLKLYKLCFSNLSTTAYTISCWDTMCDKNGHHDLLDS